MADFLETATRFPAVVYGVMLAVVVIYWLVVFLGAFGLDFLDGDSELGPAGILAALGLGGVPVMVVLSLWIAFAWFATFAATALMGDGDSGAVRTVLGSAALVGGAVAGYFVTFALVLPLRRMFPDDEKPAARSDFVGLTCIVRTVSVNDAYGQAEVTAEDGSSAIIQVRQTGEDGQLNAGNTALITEYDADQEIFWITAYA